MLVLRGLVGGWIQLAVLAALLLVPAGTWNWPRALLFLFVYWIVNSTAIVTLALRAPASLEARLSPPASESQPTADRIVTPFFIAALLGWFAFLPVDVFRWELLPRPPFALSILGVFVSAIGYACIWTTLFHNAFAAPIVKDQSERGQVLIDTGLYALVRHPFYLGILLFFLGLALWLESTAGVCALVVPLALIVLRIRIEEKALVDTLDGYADYTRRVRFKLMPYLW